MKDDESREARRAMENERLYNSIECALAMMHKKQSPAEQMDRLREIFPSPVFFLEAGDYIKRKAGLPRLDAFYFSLFPGIAHYTVEERYGEKPTLNRLSLMAEYLVQLYKGVHRERFYALLLDSMGRKTDTVLISKGTNDAALFDMKLMLSNVVRRGAKAVVLSHNHPRGTLRPSEEDIRCTLRALKALMALGVPMLDHVIVAYDRAVSMRDCGVIPAPLWIQQAPRSKLLRDWVDVDLLT